MDTLQIDVDLFDDAGNVSTILQLYLDSDEEYFEFEDIWGSSNVSEEYHNMLKRKKRRRVIVRDHASAHNRIMKDYLVREPRYTEEMFRRRFRMSSRLFKYICSDLEKNFLCFTLREDGLGRKGLSGLQKIVAALRMIAYGEGADRQDEYCSIGEKTALDARKIFSQAVIIRFSKVYLRKPSEQDVAKLLNENSRRGFPGMIGNTNTQLSQFNFKE